MKTLRNLLSKYRRYILVLYLPFYMLWFEWLEHRSVDKFHIIHCHVDDIIPFNKYFIIPYLIWFAYVVFVLIILGLQPIHLGNLIKKHKHPKHLSKLLRIQAEHLNDFYKCAATLMIGMTTSLLIYTVFPNAQDLRPESIGCSDIFLRLIANLYMNDTSTNVCPSIHVYNSLTINMALCTSYAVMHAGTIKKYIIQFASSFLCVMICLSTMYLKQHSFIDVVCAVGLYIIVYIIVYKFIYRKAKK